MAANKTLPFLIVSFAAVVSVASANSGWWLTTFPSSGTIAKKACKEGISLDIFPKSVDPFFDWSKSLLVLISIDNSFENFVNIVASFLSVTKFS